VLVVNSGASVASGVRQASGATPTLTLGDVDAIRGLDSVRAVSPTTWNTAQIMFDNQNWLGPVQGAYPDIIEVRDWALGAGGIFDDHDVRSAARKAVMGGTIAEKLFGSRNPVGETIRIRNVPFTVVGLLARKGQTLDGWDLDDIIYVPLSTARRDLFGSAFPDRVNRMMVEAMSAQALPQAEADIRLLLRTRHRIADGLEDDFVVRRQDAFYDAEQKTAGTMRTLLATIASVSLLVGGIGIMNIMLVTVTERTREIGIRKALGATRFNILLQFVVEAMVLCMLGGSIGILLGTGVAALLSRVLGWSIVVSPSAVGVDFGFSAAVGLFFGIWPARKAARLDPIEALRYE